MDSKYEQTAFRGSGRGFCLAPVRRCSQPPAQIMRSAVTSVTFNRKGLGTPPNRRKTKSPAATSESRLLIFRIHGGRLRRWPRRRAGVLAWPKQGSDSATGFGACPRQSALGCETVSYSSHWLSCQHVVQKSTTILPCRCVFSKPSGQLPTRIGKHFRRRNVARPTQPHDFARLPQVYGRIIAVPRKTNRIQ